VVKINHKVANVSIVPNLPSTDATLSALSVSNGTLTPAFDANTTEYTVSTTVSSIIINATANDAAATVSGAGTKALDYGDNTFEVVVTAEDGITTATSERTRVDESDIVTNNPSELIVMIPALTTGTYLLEVTTQYAVSLVLKDPRTATFDRTLTVA
jgi:hypothetical protein